MKLRDGVGRVRIGMFCTAPNDARSLSRLLGPFQLMEKQDPRLEIVWPKQARDGQWEVDWDFVQGLDVLYLLDPYKESDVRMVGLANACGVPVWADYIDDLLNVRPSNPVFMSYVDKKAIRQRITKVMRGAAVTTTTTETLRQTLPFSQNIVVLPESCRWPMSQLPRQQVVSWRGFGSHGEDLESVLPQIKEIANMPQFCNWEWVFFGEPLWKIFDGIIPPDKLVFIPPLSPFDLMNRWANVAPWVHIVPLADNAFNKSKTPLAWLEATAVGAAVIGPDFEEWDVAGIIHYKTSSDFGNVLRSVLESYKTGTFHPAVDISRHHIYPMLTTEAVNEIRWEILNRLLEQPQVSANESQKSVEVMG